MMNSFLRGVVFAGLTLMLCPVACQAQQAPTPDTTTSASGASDAAPTENRLPRGPIRISGGVAAQSKIAGQSPVYPMEAKRANISGIVVLHAIIGPDGSVTAVDVISGPPFLRQSAVDAVKSWRYKPYSFNGTPVEVQTTVSVNYSLEIGQPNVSLH